ERTGPGYRNRDWDRLRKDRHLDCQRSINAPLGFLIRRVDFKELFVSLSGTSYATLNDAKAAGAPTLNYGLFVNTVIEFLLIAFVLFLIVRRVNRWRQQPSPTTQECPFCRMSIPLAACRCPHCTTEFKTAVSAT